jgi:hypothetical protein
MRWGKAPTSPEERAEECAATMPWGPEELLLPIDGNDELEGTDELLGWLDALERLLELDAGSWQFKRSQ